MNEFLIKKQPIFTKIINNIIKNNKNSQAYLIIGNNEETIKKYSILLAKVLICPNSYNENCEKCNICGRINNNNYGELQIIDVDNQVIKKEEILKIRNKFITNSIEGKNSVYIINNVDKFNQSAANSILKFLEEPDSNVVAIFNTTNRNKVYDTIVSRCQLIKLNNELNNNKEEELYNITNLNKNEIKHLINFFIDIENNYENAILNLKNEIIKEYETKEKIKNILMLAVLFYKDLLYYEQFNDLEYFKEDEIKKVAISKNDILIKKISYIIDNIEKLDYNVNINLFMMNFVIGIGEINNGKGSRN